MPIRRQWWLMYFTNVSQNGCFCQQTNTQMGSTDQQRMNGSHSKLRAGWFRHLGAPSSCSKGIIGQTPQSWAVYVAVRCWYTFSGDLCSAVKFGGLRYWYDILYLFFHCVFIFLDHLLQVAALSTIEQIIKNKSLWFWCWISNPLLAQVVQP